MINLLQRSISIGPLNLPWAVVPFLAAWIIYQVLIKRLYQNRKDHLKIVDGILFNSLFITLIVWKLSPLVFQFSNIIQNPQALLYLPGGLPGVIAGAAAALCYTAVSILRRRGSHKELLRSLGINFGILLILILTLSFLTSVLVDRVDKAIPESAAVEGAPAPDFTLESEGGPVYRLSDYAGKTVVLNFWASWCPPCKAELPELEDFYEKYGGEIVFLSVNLYTSEKQPEGLSDFIRKEGITFPVLYDKTGTTAEDYSVQSIPTTVIIGPDSMVSTIKTGAVTTEWLERFLRL